MKSLRSIYAIWIVVLLLSFRSAQASVLVGFEQLNWFGTTTSTADSSWGRMSLDFTGYSSTQFFNLNIGGNWAIQNMSIGSLYGAGIAQSVTTFFDFGVSHGSDVAGLDYQFSIGGTPLGAAPVGTVFSAGVADLDYQIGGEFQNISDPFAIDLGSPGTADTGSRGKKVFKSGKLPELSKFVNHEQGLNECAPGAISNSLKYLEATGKIDFSETIDEVKEWSGWIGEKDSEKGTSSGWPALKKTYLEEKEMTVRNIEGPLTAAKILDLIKQLDAGQDIEMDLKGHVEVLVGLRWNEDGTIELDLFDDNQKKAGADKMHTSTVRLIGGKQFVDGMELERFVVEGPIPEPSSVIIWSLIGLSFVGAGWRRRKAG